MELDSKLKVLMAIYTEYQKDLPNMSSVTAKILGMDHNIFKVAIKKLDNEGLINGACFNYGGDESIPLSVATDYVMMSRLGIQYIESKLDIDPTLSGKEKVEKAKQKFLGAGIDVLVDFAAKVTAEIVKS